jgi:hypothetical protein
MVAVVVVHEDWQDEGTSIDVYESLVATVCGTPGWVSCTQKEACTVLQT